MSYNNFDGECIICFEPLKKIGEEIAVLDCNHKYHFNCIRKWINKSSINNSCCICEKNNEIVNIISNIPLQNNTNNINGNNINGNINGNNINGNNINGNNINGNNIIDFEENLSLLNNNENHSINRNDNHNSNIRNSTDRRNGVNRRNRANRRNREIYGDNIQESIFICCSIL
jgi:hypothetical protein